MEYEDRTRIATPEGVELELALAGIGSRLAARLIDLSIIGVIALVALAVYAGTVGGSSLGETLIAVIGVTIGAFIFWAYDVLLETFNGGRTVGKRALGLRVVGDRGEPETFVAAAVRNLLRPVDEVLTLWLAALISITRSSRNQRLGDMAAGTIVVKARPAAPAEPTIGVGSLDLIERAAGWDTTALTDEEMATVRRFLERRSTLDPRARARLAESIAARLRPRVHGAEDVGSAERFLELLVAAKARRG